MNRTLALVAASACLVLVIAPGQTHAQISILSELSHDREASPGQTYEGSITVRNSGKEPTEIKVYQTDYLFACDHTTRYDEPGTTPRSNAGWVTFRPVRALLARDETVNIRYTVSVPATDPSGNALVGSYWSMLMVEEIAPGSPESSQGVKKIQVGLQQKFRYGIQVATHIAGTGQKAVQFQDAKLAMRPDSTCALEVSVMSTGTLWMRADMYVELFDDQGASKGKYPGTQYRLYPGTCVRQAISLPLLPAGTYKALVVVDGGGAEAFGAQFTVKF